MVALFLGAPEPAPPAPAGRFWSAMLTVASDGIVTGYFSRGANGALTDNTYDLNGAEHTIYGLYFRNGNSASVSYILININTTYAAANYPPYMRFTNGDDVYVATGYTRFTGSAVLSRVPDEATFGLLRRIFTVGATVLVEFFTQDPASIPDPPAPDPDATLGTWTVTPTSSTSFTVQATVNNPKADTRFYARYQVQGTSGFTAVRGTGATPNSEGQVTVVQSGLTPGQTYTVQATLDVSFVSREQKSVTLGR